MTTIIVLCHGLLLLNLTSIFVYEIAFLKNNITFTYFLFVAALSRARLCQEPELLLHVVRQIRLVHRHEEGATAAVAHGGRDLHEVAPVLGTGAQGFQGLPQTFDHRPILLRRQQWQRQQQSWE